MHHFRGEAWNPKNAGPTRIRTFRPDLTRARRSKTRPDPNPKKRGLYPPLARQHEFKIALTRVVFFRSWAILSPSCFNFSRHDCGLHQQTNQLIVTPASCGAEKRAYFAAKEEYGEVKVVEGRFPGPSPGHLLNSVNPTRVVNCHCHCSRWKISVNVSVAVDWSVFGISSRHVPFSRQRWLSPRLPWRSCWTCCRSHPGPCSSSAAPPDSRTSSSTPASPRRRTRARSSPRCSLSRR